MAMNHYCVSVGHLSEMTGEMKDIALSIIIPVYNNVNFTKNCLKDLSKLPSEEYEIIIVNNGSSDETDKVVRSYLYSNRPSPTIVYVPLEHNCGFGRSNNIGYTYARGKSVLFLNNDIRVNSSYKTWPLEIIHWAERGHLVAAEAGLLDSDFKFVKEGSSIDLNEPYSYLSGWCLGGSRKTFDKLRGDRDWDYVKKEVVEKKASGPWDPRYFLYFEDDHLTFKARELEIPMKLISVPVHHFGRMTGRMYNMFGHFPESRDLFINEWRDKIGA
jgi:GT2 family glycosyltransferase